MRLTTPHGISSPHFRFQGELCLWLLKKCYPCLWYTCYLCLQSIHSFKKGGISCTQFIILRRSHDVTPLLKRGQGRFGQGCSQALIFDLSRQGKIAAKSDSIHPREIGQTSDTRVIPTVRSNPVNRRRDW